MAIKWLLPLLLVAACHGHAASTAEPTAAHYDTSCQQDADCVPMPGCCPTPCTEDVINVAELQRASSALDCSGPQNCAQAGGCRTFAYLCVTHQCKLVFDGDAAYHERSAPH